MEHLIFPDIPKECLSSCPTADLFVLSNKSRLFGAACLLYEELLSSFADMLQDDFYILPSSIHEVLLLPVKKSPPLSSLLEMVQDINQTEVVPEDVLSNHIYLYQSRENRLGIVLLAGSCSSKNLLSGSQVY